MIRAITGTAIASVTAAMLLTGSVTNDTAQADLPLPTITASIPPIKLTAPATTITLPGRTVTITPSPIPNPIPTRLPTLIPPRPTRTVTVGPRPPQQTAGPGSPRQTVTVPVTPTNPSGQTTTGRGTVLPTEEPETRTETRTKTDTIVKRVFLGTLLSILFFLVGIAALFIGYYLGGRDAYREDDKFLRGLLNRATYKSKH